MLQRQCCTQRALRLTRNTDADIAAPVVRGAAQEAAKVAGPLLQSGVSQLKSSGVDVQAAAKAVSTVAQEAAPTVTAATNSVGAFLAGTEPSVLVLELLSIAIILAVTPAVAPFIATLVRGYASDVSPLVALEMLTQDAMLVDLRKESEADIRGVPSLPRGSKGVFVACPMDTISDRALRSAISDPTALEAESTARIIASLKKASRSRRVILLDSQSSQAKLVARKLTSIGFSRVSVVEGGFDAWWVRRNCVQSRVLTPHKLAAGRAAALLHASQKTNKINKQRNEVR